jgi:two-component system sensor histidine kinase YesM
MDSNVYLLRILPIGAYSESGLMILGINKDYLAEAFSSLEGEYINNLAVIDESNRIILSNSNKTKIELSYLEFSEENEDYAFDRDNHVLKVHVSLEQPNWRIVTYIPLSQLYQEVYALRWRIIIVCLVVFVAISLLGWLAASDIVKPSMRL